MGFAQNIAILILALFGESLFARGGLTPWVDTTQTPGSLQIAITQLKEGEVFRLPPGINEGPIFIRTAGVTIDGGGEATIDGQGRGTVVTIMADGVTLKNFKVTGSGGLHDRLDAGISVDSVDKVRVQGLTIEDCLFGIDVKASNGSFIEDNVISSKQLELGLRGDAIRLWASKDIIVRRNRWTDSRDTVSWYSDRIEFSENEGKNSRYSLHSMYSKNLIIKNNRFSHNSVGIFIMYGEGTTITENTIERSIGAGGIGIGTKETSSLYVRKNQILYSTVGILIDNSPWQPGTRNWFHENTVGFCGTAILMSSTKDGNDFRLNRFIGNTIDADSENRQPSRSTWLDNYWDHYDGFDRNRDGIGDTPYRILKYGDIIAEQHPMAQFFVGSPVLSLIELVQKLVPLTKPVEILTDPSPRILRKESEESSI